ncbi:hypothetical protein [Actinotalea sp. C106]|uniref:hypothetical protein n=1 Tax=Actinotalea sp. C106 TaxID=2908644 RepID=UPI0020292343|nr:hypothetical protein [Actinotalea sp. C106]
MEPTQDARSGRLPGLTVCSLCTGETLAGADAAPGGQLGRLRRLEKDGVVRLTLVECLDECERGDVVVARPRRAARARSGPVWFERVAGDDATAELGRWLAQGGPGDAPLPAPLEQYRVERGGEPV